MIHRFKKLITGLSLALLFTFCISTAASAMVEQSEAFYVADYAGVLSSSTENEIINQNGYLEQSMNGAQIVVVTVDYLDGMYADEYATYLFNDWGVGSASENNGMLLLLAVKENKAYLVQGEGIYRSFTDSVAADYLDEYFWRYFDAGEYDKAVSTIFPQLIAWFESYYSVENPVFSDPASGGSGAGYLSLGVIIIFIVIAVFILSLAMRSFGAARPYAAYRRFPFFFFPMGGFFRPRPPRPPFPHSPPGNSRPNNFTSSGGHSFGGGRGFGSGRGFGGGGRSSGRGAGRR